jgi:hypothetical protein
MVGLGTAPAGASLGADLRTLVVHTASTDLLSPGRVARL